MAQTKEERQAYQRAWCKRRPEKRKIYYDRWYAHSKYHKRLSDREWDYLNKVQAMMYYSSGIPICRRCGAQDMDVLCIDHIEGGGTKHRRLVGSSGAEFAFWLIKQGFPEGYQVLCANCNTRKSKLEN